MRRGVNRIGRVTQIRACRYGRLRSRVRFISMFDTVVSKSFELPGSANETGGGLPADIVRLPKTDLPVTFRETEVTADCKKFWRP